MAQLKFGSAGVTAKEIDISGKKIQEPVGVPAGIIGTSNRGPAYVPVTLGIIDDFYSKFGKTDGKKFAPLAVSEWMRNATSVTFMRVLGIGDGKKRTSDGSVNNAGFIVGENQPRTGDGALFGNEFATSGSNSVSGRTFFLGALMSESAGSSVFSSANLQGAGSITPGVDSALPILRGIVLSASGVILRLSSSVTASAVPATNLIATEQSSQGSHFGTVVLSENNTAKQEFVMLLNGHKGTDSLYPSVITASFDMTSPNYFANVLNSDPLKLNKAGYCLYAHWDVHPSTAVVTGSGIVSTLSGAGASTAARVGTEVSAFLTTSSLARNVGSDTVPNYESFANRFSHAKSPWVISQKFGGIATNLFRLHDLNAGAGNSTKIKFSIENIVVSSDPADQYGSFDLIIRDWNDLDTNLKPLEQWRGLNLDPNSDRYISKVIGDANVFFNFDQVESSQRLIVDGNYTNNSSYVRVEVSSDVENQTVDATALPFGIRGASHLITSGTMPMTSPSTSQHSVSSVLKRVIQLPVPMRTNITQGSGAKLSVNPQLYWGPRFEHVTSLTTPNASILHDESLDNYAKYYPDFSITTQNVIVGDNAGTPATAQNGELDSDKFCNNIFTFDNIKVTTGSTGLADSTKWDLATYVRNGNISTDDSAKTRRLTIDDFTQANRRFLKFSFFMQGGFDGVNIFNADESEINNTSVVADMNSDTRGRQDGPSVKSFSKALDIMKNTVNADVQLVAVPGIRHPIISNAAINAVEERFDAMFIMDIEQVDNTGNNIVSDTQLPSVTLSTNLLLDRALDSSFAAAYFPDQIMKDPNTNTNVIVPPSVVVLGAMALNDKVGHPWFAPAGFVRGALGTTQEARVKLSKTNLDALYDAGINPLTAWPGNATAGTNPKGGVVVWGQKTLQASASALDRVNVRRLLIDIRRQVRDVAQTIIFEPNREATLAKFSSAVTPKLQRVQALAGLEKFKVIIDSSTTTQADIENNVLRGKIYVQPTKTIEFVSLDFVVSNRITE